MTTTSTLSTFNFKEVKTDYDLILENKLIDFTLDGRGCIIDEPQKEYESFLSEDKKIFLQVSSSQFHILYNTLGTILHLFEQDKDTLFILNTDLVNQNILVNSVKDFFFKLLDHHEIRYEIYSNNLRVNRINAKNFYIRKSDYYDVICHKPATNITKYIIPFIKNKEVKPFRKIYLSRGLANNQKDIFYGSEDVVQINKKLFNRIDNEEKLEEYFASCGFEIVYPEDFKTFEEQINFFNEVKTVVSLSGAGLTNAIFMQQGSNVVELLTSHYVWKQRYENKNKIISITEEEHFFYISVALEKGHDYVAINNKEKNADTLINRINQNPIFKEIISQCP